MTRSPDVSAESLTKVLFIKKNQAQQSSVQRFVFLATMSGIRRQLSASALLGQHDKIYMWGGGG